MECINIVFDANPLDRTKTVILDEAQQKRQQDWQDHKYKEQQIRRQQKQMTSQRIHSFFSIAVTAFH